MSSEFLNNFLKDNEKKTINIHRSIKNENQIDEDVLIEKLRQMLGTDIDNLNQLLKSDDVESLKKAQAFILETPLSANAKLNDFNSALRMLRTSYLGPIVNRITELTSQESNLRHVCDFINDKNNSYEVILEYEYGLYSLLPSPWCKMHSQAVEVSREIVHERIKNVMELSQRQNYMDWAEMFMTTIGALNVPVIYKIEALSKSLKKPFNNLLSHIRTHGYTFYTYYRIIKDLESICLDSKKVVKCLLQEAYNYDYGIGTEILMMSFYCKLIKIMNIVDETMLKDIEPDILEGCYTAMGPAKSSEFHAYCNKYDRIPKLVYLHEWIRQEINELSNNTKV